MPQLITLPYHHAYISLLLILLLSFLLFLRYFLPTTLKSIKVLVKSSLKAMHNNLIYFVFRDLLKERNDLYFTGFIELFLFAYTVSFQMYSCLYREFIRKDQLLKYNLNDIFFHFFREVSIYACKLEQMVVEIIYDVACQTCVQTSINLTNENVISFHLHGFLRYIFYRCQLSKWLLHHAITIRLRLDNIHFFGKQ